MKQWNIDREQMRASREIGAILKLRVEPQFTRSAIAFRYDVENMVLTSLARGSDYGTLEEAMAAADGKANSILLEALNV